MIHCCPVMSPPRSDRIRTSATFTIEMSKVMRKNPREAIVMTIRECGESGITGISSRVVDATRPTLRAARDPWGSLS